MANARILVVDDEPGMLEVCVDTLNDLPDTDVLSEQDSSKAAKLLLSEPWDILITDIKMPGTDGIELLRLARRQDAETLVLMLTAYPSVETAVASMKLGAADYITKPFLPDDLQHKVERLLIEKKLQEENRLLRRQVKQDHRMGEMIGKCPPMQKVFETIRRIANADIDVLILGETGTGKELVARNIHQNSNRKNNNFVPIDCGAIPQDLMESEFFGHEKGAFTGAAQKNMGLLEFADKGTFFLDEIGHLPLKLQAKLLRVLQERKIRRVGGNREREIDVRIIAATSLDLEKEIREERFRMDLYHRINVAQVDLPPLRKRVEDIPLLVSHFLELQSWQLKRDSIEMDPEALEVLKYYHWPGNVRELQNVLKKTLVMTQNNPIGVEDLPDDIITAAGDYSESESAGFFELRDQHIADFEKQYFAELLEAHKGDVTKAAEQAKIPRGTMYRLLKKNNFDPADFRP
ncbi:MAG: sigma-54 dependent transcriptional regulator [Gracilimonas sp.]|uniref:sigma-54-dependent transcriptional regulator n=1 Tax=Gracilimonas sp. TaxID=1974203 RepID=UPI003751F1B2|nr:sigma-54 dependent transcriptional regulator [Gracilimonas sp.]